ncbi:hypothetical protein LCGC14_0607810 [marine sediment metagenome]|uniref:HK97 gp10 family phage protein n=1 Tax=marine sediment metagenome TaxID=412755 RepID=A0A0F9RDF7_9ZZZZ
MAFQDKLTRQFQLLADKDFSDAVLAGADVLLAVAKPDSPVDTGFMKGSHNTRKAGKNEALFEVATEYAVIVEYRQPWVRPAIDRSFIRIVKAVGKHIEDDIKHVV